MVRIAWRCTLEIETNHCLVSRVKCNESFCFVLFAFVQFLFISKFVHIQCLLRNSCWVLNGIFISNCIVLACFRSNMYMSLFHTDIGAPRHVIPTIITERNRDLEKVYIHVSLLTKTTSLAKTKHFYIGTPVRLREWNHVNEIRHIKPFACFFFVSFRKYQKYFLLNKSKKYICTLEIFENNLKCFL